MKKWIAFLLALVVTLGLSACKTPTEQNPAEATNESAIAATGEPAALPTTVDAEVTVLPTTAPTAVTTEVPTAEASELTTDAPTGATAEIATEVPAETLTATADDPTEVPPTAAPTEEPTEVPHSDLYVAGVSQDEIVAYFNEVVLDMESAGDAAVVRKWDRPIAYRIEGAPSRRDAQVISELCKALNTVEGFPGIQAATGLEQNLAIYFLREAEFKTQFSHLLGDGSADGAVQFWYYNDTNNIYNGRIGYRKDADQNIKDSVIPGELLKALGIGETALREDSIVYQNGSEVTELSDVDWAIIKLLYSPEIQCGMNAAECETIIRELYY